MKRTIFLTCLISIFFIGFASAQKGFIKMGDIKGESKDRAHQEWIVIESFNQALETQKTTGATRSRNMVTVPDVMFTKSLDKSTAKLMKSCADGQVIPEVVMEMISDDGKPLYRVTLNNVRISGVNSNLFCDPECKIREEVSLNYSKITWQYIDKTGNTVEATYNVQGGN